MRFEGDGRKNYDIFLNEEKIGGVHMTDYMFMSMAAVPKHLDLLTWAHERSGEPGILAMLGALIEYRWDDVNKVIRFGVNFDPPNMPAEQKLSSLAQGLGFSSIDQLMDSFLRE